jgi:predicted dehydrogenase
MILGEITEVSAYVANMSSDLAGPETLVANLQFANGVMGHYSATYATGPKRQTELSIRGEAGYISVGDSGIKIQHGDETLNWGDGRTLTINAELRAFAEAIRNGGPNPNSPEEALQDLAVMEAILNSAERKQPVTVEQVLQAVASR